MRRRTSTWAWVLSGTLGSTTGCQHQAVIGERVSAPPASAGEASAPAATASVRPTPPAPVATASAGALAQPSAAASAAAVAAVTLASAPPAATGATSAANATGLPSVGDDHLPGFEVEQPFKLFERPRLPGAVQAAVHDELLARWNVGGTGDPTFISNRSNYHPGARVVVDTTVVAGRLPVRSRHGRRRGVLSQQGLLAQSRTQGYWPFRLCFEDGLRRQQTLE